MGEVITFYSYKGGTGRTMALANTACLFARQTPGKVLVIDWDLEAPGLFSYFEDYCPPESKHREGLIELMIKANADLPPMPFGKEKHDLLSKFFEEIDNYLIQLNINNKIDNLFLLKAGNEHQDYNQKNQNFNWTTFFHKMPAFFTNFAHYLSKHFDYILIDSRTGHTDIGGICTMLMPDKLVLAFTPNKQSLNGVIALGRKAVDYRHGSFDLRPLKLYPLPSRVDLEAPDLKADWQTRYNKAFTKLFEEIYQLPWVSLDNYFQKVQIRHSAEFAYGEKIAALDDTLDDNSIQRNFKQFCIQLERPKIWHSQPFKSLDEPLKAFVIYTNDDKNMYEKLQEYLKTVENEGGIKLSDFDSPIDKWDEMNGTAVKNLRQGFDIIFKIMTPNLVKQQQKWAEDIEDINEKSISIFTQPMEDINKPYYKIGTKKPIFAYENISWEDVTNEIKDSILDAIYDKLKTPTHA